MHPWVTLHGQDTLPSAEENCKLVEVTEEDVANATKDFASFPVLVKSMPRSHFPRDGTLIFLRSF